MIPSNLELYLAAQNVAAQGVDAVYREMMRQRDVTVEACAVRAEEAFYATPDTTSEWRHASRAGKLIARLLRALAADLNKGA